MSIGGRMAGIAILGCVLIQAILMAALTGDVNVFAGQQEGCTAVIEGHILPVGRMMAGSTVRAKLARVGIILVVAGETIYRSAFKE